MKNIVKSSMPTLLAATMMQDEYFDIGSKRSKENNFEHKCIQCGKMHTHNNSFCSAECCKKWKQSKEIKK